MPHLSLQRILLPSVQVSALTTGKITLESAAPSRYKLLAGYIAGGVEPSTPGGSGITTVEKYLFSTEVRSTLGTGLSVGMYDVGGAFTNLCVAGYVLPGYGGGYQTVINKFLRAVDTRSTLASGTSHALYSSCAWESKTHGFAAGGQKNDGFRRVDVDKYSFADDSRSTLGTGIGEGIMNGRGFSSGTHGYMCGGYNNSGVTVTTVRKMAFSDETHSTLGTGLEDQRTNPVGTFSSFTHGYYVGGQGTEDVGSGPYRSSIERFSFSDDSRTILNFRQNGQQLGNFSGGAFYNAVAGFIGGGRTTGVTGSGEAASSVMRKYPFATEHPQILHNSLSASKHGCHGGFQT